MFQNFAQQLRIMLEIPASESIRPTPRGCCGPWFQPLVLIFIFVVVIAAMVKLTIAGVPLTVAVAVVIACGALTTGLAIRLFGSGFEPA